MLILYHKIDALILLLFIQLEDHLQLCLQGWNVLLFYFFILNFPQLNHNLISIKNFKVHILYFLIRGSSDGCVETSFPPPPPPPPFSVPNNSSLGMPNQGPSCSFLLRLLVFCNHHSPRIKWCLCHQYIATNSLLKTW